MFPTPPPNAHGGMNRESGRDFIQGNLGFVRTDLCVIQPSKRAIEYLSSKGQMLMDSSYAEKTLHT